MIRVDNLCKYYGPVLAVDHVSFAVNQGEIVGFLGPNGAGKSTTMRILTTYLPATTGIASVAGFDVMKESMQVRQKIGYLPESVPLYPEMRVEEYLTFRSKIKGVERSQRNARLDYCLDRCRIREVRRRLIGTLSRGYKQRVGLADAMIHNPPILILDEPTSGLDPGQILETLDTIKSLGQSHTILLSTHHLDEVEAACGRVIIIAQGQVKLDRPMAELASEGAHVILEVRGPRDEVTKAVKGIAGVTGVSVRDHGDGLATYEVSATTPAKVLEDLSAKVTGSGWGLRRIELYKPRLQDHFMAVTSRSVAAEPAAMGA